LSFQPNGNGDAPIKREYNQRASRSLNAVLQRPQSEITVSELWQMLLKRRSTFFLCFALAVAVTLIISLILPTRYEGVGRLTLDFDSNALQDVLAKASGIDDDVKLQTQVKVLETDSLAWEIIKRLRLDQRPETAHRRFAIGPAVCLSSADQSPESISPECRNVLLKEFHNRLRVQSVPRTQIIEIRYRCKSRELAAQVVNTMAEAYMETSFQTKYQAALRASKWVSGQLTEAKDNAQKAEENFIAYQKQTGIIGTDENHNVLIERLNAINQQLVVAEASRIVREARYRVSLSGDPEALVDITPGSPLQVLHSEQVALNSQYAQLNAKFDEAYPRVQQVKAQLNKVTTALNEEEVRSKNKIKSEYEAALGSETQLRKEFEQQKQEAYDTNEATIQVALLKRDVDASRELYEQLVKQLNEAGVLAGLRSTNVTVIDPASVPVDPVEPHPALNLAFGMFAGSVLGLALCFVQENIDTTILTPKDLASVGTLPALGIVPRLWDGRQSGRIGPSQGKTAVRVAVLERPEGMVADAYRSLRTALLLSNAGTPPKVLLITSALPREGKTTTSVNTAVVFAQKDRRVLLVDGDLRRADLNRCFDLPRNGGLSAALVGEDPKQFYVTHRELPSLVILPAGVRPPKPPDLLDSDRMRELISIWRQEFDHIIIDAPPVIGLSDSVILATMTDTVVLVVRAQQSRRQDFCLAQEILASVDANVGGAVINDFQLNGSGPYGYTAKLYGAYFDENGRRNGRG
jgi:capsular exopolysaccharide synthesis family protein